MKSIILKEIIMGLYSGANPSIKFGFVWRQFKYPVLGIAVLIIAFALLLLVVLPALQPKPLDAFLQPNPLDLTKELVGVSYLTVVLNNTTGATAKNVVVEVSTEASDAITIFPASKAIETLGKGESRALSNAFVISPNPAKKALSGTYIITVKTKINELSVEKQVALELKAV